MIYITYNAYITYIFIYITASYTSPTSSNLSNLTSLTTSSSSSTTWATSPTSATVDQLLGNSYETWTMSFTKELTCRWSISTWTPTRLLPARSFCTEIVTQELLHRGSANFQVIKLYLNSCKIIQFFYFSLAAGTARRWLTNRYPLRRVGHPNVLRNAGLVCPWATLCGDGACRTGKHVVWWNAKLLCRSSRLRRSCVSNAQTCGGTWISFGHGQPSSEIAQVGHPNMWQNANLARPGTAPSHEMRVNRQKLV